MRRGGFVLPVALVVMVAVSLLALTTLQVAMNDFQANRSTRLASRALYAAEAGADLILARWGSGPYAALAPGDSAPIAWSTLPDGALYRSSVLRVDDGLGPTPLFRVLVEGRPTRRATARRQILVMVEATAGGACCDAAASIRGSILIRAPSVPKGEKNWTPPPQVDGRDHVPASWAGYCPSPASAIPGVAIDDDKNVTLQRGASAEGDPPFLEDATIDRSVADALGTTPYSVLAAGADMVFPSKRTTRLTGKISPAAKKGVCDTSDDRNWGAPTAPGSACWDYLPVIHAQGNLRIDAKGEGQGILLVDGDLTITSAFSFYGSILVKGQAIIRGGATVTGVLQAANRANGKGTTQIRDKSVVRFSSCATARSTGSQTGGARYLPGRHWFEIP